jgi:hypothetical protein
MYVQIILRRDYERRLRAAMSVAGGLTSIIIAGRSQLCTA